MKKRQRPETPLRLAAFTVVRDEPFFLPLWLKYYSRIVDTIHVFDHFSEGGSIIDAAKNYGFDVLRFDTNDPSAHKWAVISDVVKAHFGALIDTGDFDYVIYSDVDEFIVPDPRFYVDLRHYIEKMADETLPKNVAWCTGWQVVHDMENEPPIDPARSLLTQRKFMKEDVLYNKPLIGRVHMNWCPGQHYIHNTSKAPDKNLSLFHMHYIDRDVCAARYVRRFPGADHLAKAIENISVQRRDATPIPKRYKHKV